MTMASWKYDTPPKILYIEDDFQDFKDYRSTFTKYQFYWAGDIEKAKQLLSKNKYDLILLDLKFGGKWLGEAFIPYIKKKYAKIPVIILSNSTEINRVVKTIHSGAVDYLCKREYNPLEWTRKIDKVLKGEATHPADNATGTRINLPQTHTFIGKSVPIKAIKRKLTLVAEKPDITVLLTGETGVGKEVAAHYLYQNSPRNQQAFQAVNLSAIQKNLLESTLFGHKKGAFTGATKDAEGYFKQANGGILFLDEIGEISLELQVKLLRFLETKIIRAVGGNKDIRLDIQIVVATNRNLKEEVAKGNFREDLYYRLHDFPIEIPPLRARKEDIPLLVDFFLKKQGLSPNQFTHEVRQQLLQYQWPGNVRELHRLINRLHMQQLILDKEQIDIECWQAMQPNSTTTNSLPSIKTSPPMPPPESSPISQNGILSADDRERRVAMTELRQIEQALKETRGQKRKAGALIDMNLDQMRYCVKKYHRDHPAIFEHFPIIREKYKLK